MAFLSNPYFTPDVIGEPLTNRNFSYIKVFGICPSPRAPGGSQTHNLRITRHDFYRSATHSHMWSYKTASGARLTVSGIVVSTSDLMASSFYHPYFLMSSSGGSASLAARHMDVWLCFTFYSNTSLVGAREHNLGIILFSLPKHWVVHLFLCP
jgi:hypothetical protein